VEAYNGYDGHGYAVYANGRSMPSNIAKRRLRLPHHGSSLQVGPKAACFFQLGWADPYFARNTTPVHTTSDGLTAYESHNDVSRCADPYSIPGSRFTAGVVKQLVADALWDYDDPTRD